jgi:predicted nucleotidyltransferase component of viral defense system
VISKQELLQLRAEWQLDVGVIEKDYVLGWLLAAITAEPELSRTWIFKGGTCLRKCYYETYRFSEDLVRHEAPYDRAGVKGLRRGPVAAGS